MTSRVRWRAALTWCGVLLLVGLALIHPAAQVLRAGSARPVAATSSNPGAMTGAVPGSVGQSNGVIDVFWPGSSRALVHEWYVPGVGWSGPTALGGAMVSNPSPVTTGGGVIDTFWEGTNGDLWHNWYVGGTWYGPQDLGMGVLGSSPVAVSPASGQVDVFWRGGDAGLWYATFANGHWAGPMELASAGSLTSAAYPMTDGGGHVTVFYRNAARQLAQVAATNGVWSGPQQLASGPLGSAPHPVYVGGGSYYVFWDGTDGGLWYAYGTTAGVTLPLAAQVGQLGSEPFVVSSTAGEADVFWEGTNAAVWSTFFVANSRGGLSQKPSGTIGSVPDPTTSTASLLDVFWIGTDGGLWHDWTFGGGAGSGGWYGPQELVQPPPTSITLSVPVYFQQEALTCEESALRMVLAYNGIGVSESQILGYEGIDLAHPRAGVNGGGDPDIDFVGNPNGSEVLGTGYGAYWQPIQNSSAYFGLPDLFGGQGLSPNSVYAYVLAGDPVIFWVPFDWDTPATTFYTAWDGRSVIYAGPEEHAMVVTGVTPTAVQVNDPDRGQYWVTKSQFEANFGVYDDMAVVDP